MYNQTLVDKIENVNLLHNNADERVLTERWKQPGDIVSFKSLVKDGNSVAYSRRMPLPVLCRIIIISKHRALQLVIHFRQTWPG